MFEFIGVVVVAWVAWVIIKGVVNGASKGTLLRACDYATSLGVPYDFASKTINNHSVIKQARLALAQSQGSKFKSIDVYKQYGHAISLIFESSNQTSNVSTPDSVKSKLKALLNPQIETLETEGTGVHINDITYVYIGALTTSITKKPISIEEIKKLITYLFPDKEHEFAIQNGYAIVSNSSDFLDKCKEILPVVNEELERNKGEFFVKYTRKAKKAIDSMFEANDDYDPRTVKRSSFLDV